ncbi:MAG: hypothetical protein HQM15_09250 [Deltaproteobacteria bacterium]|nr:hypothetical protein [Deltaproteobacteria bacterium]
MDTSLRLSNYELSLQSVYQVQPQVEALYRAQYAQRISTRWYFAAGADSNFKTGSGNHTQAFVSMGPRFFLDNSTQVDLRAMSAFNLDERGSQLPGRSYISSSLEACVSSIYSSSIQFAAGFCAQLGVQWFTQDSISPAFVVEVGLQFSLGGFVREQSPPISPPASIQTDYDSLGRIRQIQVSRIRVVVH